jgi:hypothetical protein
VSATSPAKSFSASFYFLPNFSRCQDLSLRHPKDTRIFSKFLISEPVKLCHLNQKIGTPARYTDNRYWTKPAALLASPSAELTEKEDPSRAKRW